MTLGTYLIPVHKSKLSALRDEIEDTAKLAVKSYEESQTQLRSDDEVDQRFEQELRSEST